MNIYLLGVVILQTAAAGFAVVLNGFLIYVIRNFTKNNLGFYKTILTSYCIFEIFYAIVACIGMPVHYITKGTFIGMTFLGPLVGTPLHKFGPTFYCLFYQLWLGFIMFNFIYRYFMVCKPEWSAAIKYSRTWKILIGFALFLYVLACVFCSHYLCTANIVPQEILEEVLDHFELDNNTVLSYYATNMKNVDGSYSPQSIVALGVHYFDVYGSMSIIGFCSYKIYKAIKGRLKFSNDEKLNVSLENQLFLSLVIQALIPIIMCNIPSFYILLYPILPDNILISLLTPLWTISLTFPKGLDPVITIVCITEYKQAVRRLLRVRCGGSVDQNQVYTVSNVGLTEIP